MRIQISKTIALYVSKYWYPVQMFNTYYGKQLDFGPMTLCIGNGKTHDDYDNGK